MALLKWLQIRRRLPTKRVSNPGMKNGHQTIEKTLSFTCVQKSQDTWLEKKENGSANRAHFLKGSFEERELSNTQGRKEMPVNLLPRRLCCRVMQKDREMLGGGRCVNCLLIFTHINKMLSNRLPIKARVKISKQFALF